MRITVRVPLGNGLFESQAQLLPTEGTDRVGLPCWQHSHPWIVIIYVGDIRYLSGEGRLSDEDVDQLGKEPVAEDKLASPAIVRRLSLQS